MQGGRLKKTAGTVLPALLLAVLIAAAGAFLPRLAFAVMDRNGQGVYTQSIPEMSLSAEQLTYLDRLQISATLRTESQVGAQLTRHDSAWAEKTARQYIARYAAEGVIEVRERDAKLLSVDSILLVSDAGSLVAWRVYFFWAEDDFDICLELDDETGLPLYFWLYDTSAAANAGTAAITDFYGERLWQLASLYVCQIDELLQGSGENPLADATWDGSEREVVCYTSLQSTYQNGCVLGILFTGDRRGWMIWPSVVYPNEGHPASSGIVPEEDANSEPAAAAGG